MADGDLTRVSGGSGGNFDAAGAAAAAQAASEPLDSDLQAIAALATTTFGRNLLALADAASARSALLLGTAATQASTAFDTAGAAATAQAAAIAASEATDADLDAIAALSTTSFGRSLLTSADAAALRSAEGLGTAATKNTGTASGTVAAGDDSRFTAETVNAGGNSGAAVTLPDVTTATVHRYTLTANCAFTLPAPAAGKSFTLVLVQDATGSRTATYTPPSGTVKWPGGTAPTLTTTATKIDVLSFLCADGANFLGFVSGQNF